MDPQQPVVQKDWQAQIFGWSARNSKRLISFFWLVYIFILGVFAIGIFQTITNGPLHQFFYDLGKKFGQSALLMLGVVVMPGILGRFRLEIKVSRIITLFRRQLGITVFLLAFTHWMLLRMIDRLTGVLPLKPPLPLFETVGFTTLFLLFLLFLTSNNFSVTKMGRWWKRLHRIIYVILWLVVLHTGLQRISIWTILVAFFAILEVASLIYDNWRKKKTLLSNCSLILNI